MAIRCAVFDFDGTLVLSNEIKRIAFYEVVSGVSGAPALLDAILARPDAGDRHAIFAALHAGLAGKASGLPGSDAWAQAYTRQCEAAIAAAPDVPGARDALAALAATGTACYVNSATPQVALVPIVAQRDFAPYLRASFGAPATKLHNLETIAVREQCTRDEMAMIGDSEADRSAADAFGCRFIGIGGDSTRFARAPAQLLPDLHGLPAMLAA